MSKSVRYLLISLGILVAVVIVGYLAVFLMMSSIFGPYSSKAELIENYEDKPAEIYAVQQWMQHRVPQNCQVYIEFDGEDKLGILRVSVADSAFQAWDLPIASNKTQRALNLLGWEPAVLQEAREKLDQANCISVRSGEPCQIGFRRSGMGMYFYNVFARPLSDSVKRMYNDSCHYLPYKPQVVLEHEGGAAGPQCFPD